MVKRTFDKGISVCIKNIEYCPRVEQIKINVSSLKYSLPDKSPIKLQFSVNKV